MEVNNDGETDSVPGLMHQAIWRCERTAGKKPVFPALRQTMVMGCLDCWNQRMKRIPSCELLI
jgi:hypothetical protein